MLSNDTNLLSSNKGVEPNIRGVAECNDLEPFIFSVSESVVLSEEIVSRLLFNAKWAIFQLYYYKNGLGFY